MNSRAIGVLAALGIGTAAVGQTPSFIYHFDVANPSLTPGQTTTVTVLCGFSPGIGQPIMRASGPIPVAGLSSGAFDLLATGGSWSLGAPPNGSLIPPMNFTPGTTHGVASGGGVSGVTWGNGFGPPIGTVSTLNPTPLWQATFTAPATLGPITLNVQPIGLHGVWAAWPGAFALEVYGTQTTGAQTVINVIPTPASLALVTVGFLVAARRRGGNP